MADKVARRLTPIEKLEYDRRCAELTERHMAAFSALLQELQIVIHAGEPYKLHAAHQNEDNYRLAV